MRDYSRYYLSWRFAGQWARFAAGLGLIIWMTVAHVSPPLWAFATVLGLWVGRSFISRRYELRWLSERLKPPPAPEAPPARKTLRAHVVHINGRPGGEP
jgi:hypothetical protein